MYFERVLVKKQIKKGTCIFGLSQIKTIVLSVNMVYQNND